MQGYLDNSNTDDVANLIMIATPNEGSILADIYYPTDTYTPAVYDLLTGSEATQADINPNTQYYTISGIIYPNTWNGGGNPQIPGYDDGVVAVESVESEEYINLGPIRHYHLHPPGQMEYDLVEHILTGQR
jgi:hypothetical protein